MNSWKPIRAVLRDPTFYETIWVARCVEGLLWNGGGGIMFGRGG